MNIILLGAPGSGKGTQGTILSKRLDIPRVATGDLLRAAVRDDTPLGREASQFMTRGELVPDRVILGLIEEVLASPDAERGILMDGFPRTVAQAEAVDARLAERGRAVDHVLTFEVPRDELVRRMIGRAAAEGRSDDTPEAFEQRLAVYEEQTTPLLDYYRRRGILTVLDGTGSIDDIAGRVMEAIEQ